MTPDEAREIIIAHMDYAAYKETASSLYDSDKNRLHGSNRYQSGREIVRPSPWEGDEFELRMAELLAWAKALGARDPALAQAQTLLEHEDSVLGRVIRLAQSGKQA
jgi:hypothetical protein